MARRASDAGPWAVSCHYRRDGFREPQGVERLLIVIMIENPRHYSKFVLKENIIVSLGITMPPYVSHGLTERL